MGSRHAKTGDLYQSYRHKYSSEKKLRKKEEYKLIQSRGNENINLKAKTNELEMRKAVECIDS